MSEEIQALTVPVDEMVDATQPLVVIDAQLLANINTIGQQVASLGPIETDEQNEAAANLLKTATSLLNEVEKNATAANAPYNKITKAISTEKAKASKPLEGIKSNLKSMLGAYVIKKDNERMEAERKAAEQRAKEAAELAALNKSRAEAAAAAGAEAPAPLVAASQVITAKPGVAKANAVKVIKKQKVVITDHANVPRAYLVPSLELIEGAWKRGEIVPEFHPFFRVEEVVDVAAK